MLLLMLIYGEDEDGGEGGKQSDLEAKDDANNIWMSVGISTANNYLGAVDTGGKIGIGWGVWYG